MLRNKTGAILVGLQIALTLAVVANAVFIIMQRVEKIGRPPGIDSRESDLRAELRLWAERTIIATRCGATSITIRAMPGVVAASSTNGIPLSGGGSSIGYFGRGRTREVKAIHANYYEVDEHGVDALGVKLAEGRAFTEAGNPVHRQSRPVPRFVPVGDHHAGLGAGAVRRGAGARQARLRRPGSVGASSSASSSTCSARGSTGTTLDARDVFMPRIPTGPIARYVVRAEPGRRDALMPRSRRSSSRSNLSRAITWVRPHDYYIERSYRRRQPHGRVPERDRRR